MPKSYKTFHFIPNKPTIFKYKNKYNNVSLKLWHSISLSAIN